MLEIQRGWLLNYNGEKVNVKDRGSEGVVVGPFSTVFDGVNVKVTVNLDGNRQLAVSWDGYLSTFIQIPENSPSVGLCGDNNKTPSNEFDAWGITGNTVDMFSNVMRVMYRSDSCEMGSQPRATADILCGDNLNEVIEFCEELVYGEEFTQCRLTHNVTNFVDSCVFAQCNGFGVNNKVSPNTDGVVSPGCVVASALAYRCSQEYWVGDEGRQMVVPQPDLALWEGGDCASVRDREDVFVSLGCPQPEI
eukprot:sb/3468797/